MILEDQSHHTVTERLDSVLVNPEWRDRDVTSMLFILFYNVTQLIQCYQCNIITTHTFVLATLNLSGEVNRSITHEKCSQQTVHYRNHVEKSKILNSMITLFIKRQ